MHVGHIILHLLPHLHLLQVQLCQDVLDVVGLLLVAVGMDDVGIGADGMNSVRKVIVGMGVMWMCGVGLVVTIVGLDGVVSPVVPQPPAPPPLPLLLGCQKPALFGGGRWWSSRCHCCRGGG